MNLSSNNRLRVVIADDDSDDHYFIKTAIYAEYNNAHITSVHDGQELIDYLLRKDRFSNRADELPHFVLVDINMPGKSGFEAIEELRQIEGMKQVYFFILSTSQSNEDIKKSFKLGADGFYTKPNSITTLKYIIQQIVKAIPTKPGLGTGVA
jgi:CheY-like chemotaxis protein